MRQAVITSLTALGLSLSGLASADLTLYSGRGESFVAPMVQQFEANTGIKVNVRYGDTAALASLILEEGTRSPADLYWGQDAGAMGSLSKAGVLAELPASLYAGTYEIFSSNQRNWVSTSGRSRLLAYSTERASAEQIPDSIFDLAKPEFKGRVGWAPTNGSFQAFLTAMRVAEGEAKTEQWLRDMIANKPVVFRNNTTIIEGIANGDVDFGLVNNYYLPRFVASNANFPVKQGYFEAGDIGNLVNVAGAGVLATSRKQAEAIQFLEFLTSAPAQQYFTSVVNEYPILTEVIQNPVLGSTAELLRVSPRIDLDDLDDLEGTLALLRKVGLL